MENLHHSVGCVFSNEDLTLTILSHLGKKEWASSAVVSKLWNNYISKIVRTEIKNDFKKVVDLTVSKLNESQIKKFEDIELQMNALINEQVGLSSLSSSVGKIKQLILNTLIELDQSKLEELNVNSKNKLVFFRDIYLLASIQKHANSINKLIKIKRSYYEKKYKLSA